MKPNCPHEDAGPGPGKSKRNAGPGPENKEQKPFEKLNESEIKKNTKRSFILRLHFYRKIKNFKLKSRLTCMSFLKRLRNVR